MRRRTGFSLLELLAVVSLLGIFALVVSSRMSCTMGGNLSSRGDARRLALDLLQAQRRAIATGDNHFIELTETGYTIYRRGGKADVAVDTTREFSHLVQIKSSHTELEFTFDGAALAAYTVNVMGGDKTWQITVTPSTGAVQMVAI